MQGKGFLKVCGILMIIGGAIGLISSIILAATAGVTAVALAYVGISAGVIVAAAIIGVIGSALELVAGILGVKNCDKPEKAMSCVVMGIVVAALTIVSNIIYFSGILSLLLGLVLPVLYLIGAFLNKKAAA